MSDDLNPDVRRLVELARKARTPGEDDKLRLAERLAVPLAAGAALGSAAGAAKAATGASLFASLGTKVAALVALSAVAAAVVVTKLETKPTPAVSRAQVESAKPPLPTAPSASVSEALPVPSAAPEPPLSEPVIPQKPGASGAHPASPAHELEEEAALLHQAQSAWRNGQSAQALQLANQHAQRFPRSQLANERDVLRVLSLCKLGQTHAAKQVGARLLRTAKGSPWYQSVAQSCAAQ
jgi:hypothetical protein